jgi:transcriptional regulator with XRE-family HTH domain
MNFTKTITRTDLGIISRVSMKRFAQGISAEQLSFLIGKPTDYIDQIELLQADVYSAEDLNCIAAALHEKDGECFYSAKEDDSLLEVAMSKELVTDKLVYSCNIINPDQQKLLYYSLQDEAAELQHQNETHYVLEKTLITNAISILILTGYFYEGRLAVEIYQSLNSFLEKKINPDLLREVVHSFITDQQEEQLEISKNDDNRLVYQRP